MPPALRFVSLGLATETPTGCSFGAIGRILNVSPYTTLCSRAIARFNDLRRFLISDHKSPTRSIRAAIFLTLNVRGSTLPLSTSSHVHGADTGAPGFGRTAYTAA